MQRFSLLSVLILACSLTVRAATPVPAAPVAPVEPATDTYFGTSITDPYRWMENEKDPRLLKFLHEEGDRTSEVLATIPGRDALEKRISQLASAGTSVYKVTTAGPYFFYFKLAPSDQTPKLYVRKGVDGEEHLLADVNADQSGGAHHTIDWFTPSLDGRHVALGVSAGGSEDSILRVVETDSGKMLTESIERARFGVTSWLPDNRTFWYLRLQKLADDAAPTAKYQRTKVFQHKLGDDPSGDHDAAVLGYDVPGNVEVGETELATLSYSPASKYLVATVRKFVKREIVVYVTPMAKFHGAGSHFDKVVTEDDNVINADVHGDDLYLLSHDHASRFKILDVDMRHPQLSGAEEIVAPSDAVLTNLGAAKDALYVQQLDGGIGKMLRVDFKTHAGQELSLPYQGAISETDINPERAGLLMKMTSWTRPQLWYAYDAKTGSVTDTRLRAPSPVDYTGIVSEEVLVTASDGTKVPLSIVHRADIKLDGSNPTILEGYGSYGITLDPGFNPMLLAWLEHGGVYATAHVRGGGEFGEDWHRAGQKLTKMNTVTDFIACGEYLISHQFTSSAKLAGQGGSAGGITVGGTITQRPELFAVIIDNVGVSDNLRVELSPNGPTNTPEFGSVTTEDGFKGLYAMSSYHHVKDGTAYPAILLTTGANDPRVAPWQMAKMTARLQAANSSGKPILLRVDFDAGHGIGSTKEQGIKETADEWSFILWQTGDPAFQPQ